MRHRGRESCNTTPRSIVTYLSNNLLGLLGIGLEVDGASPWANCHLLAAPLRNRQCIEVRGCIVPSLGIIEPRVEKKGLSGGSTASYGKCEKALG